MENYRERTLVASISSLVSEKCDLKGRRIKGDKLFSTTVNRRKTPHSRPCTHSAQHHKAQSLGGQEGHPLPSHNTSHYFTLQQYHPSPFHPRFNMPPLYHPIPSIRPLDHPSATLLAHAVVCLLGNKL
uniref:Uncharacterized protein n=2 Tax=Seriola TaxID=8160 RepID=A0A3B4VHV9_SERDU